MASREPERALVLTASRTLGLELVGELRAAFQVEFARSETEARERLATGAYGVIVADVQLAHLLSPSAAPVVLVAQPDDLRAAIDAVNAGVATRVHVAGQTELVRLAGDASVAGRLPGPIDPVTGALTTRALYQRLSALCASGDRPVGAVGVALDGLGAVNAGWGIDAGDRALRLVSAALARAAGGAPIGRHHRGDRLVVIADGASATEELPDLCKKELARLDVDTLGFPVEELSLRLMWVPPRRGSRAVALLAAIV